MALKKTLEHMDLIAIFRAFHPKAAEYTYFSSVYGIFSRIVHMLGHKINLNKSKKIEIISRTSLIQHSTGSPSHSNQTRRRNKRHPNWKGRSKTVIIEDDRTL